MTSVEWDAAVARTWRAYMLQGVDSTDAYRRAVAAVEREIGPRPAPDPEPQKEPGAIRLPWYVKLGARFAGAFVGGNMKSKLNRWLPIIGGVALALEAILKALGQPDLAGIVATISGVLGASGAVPDWVSGIVATVVPAALVIYGAIRKVIATRKG